MATGLWSFGARYEFRVRRPGRWKFRGNCCVFQVLWQIHFHYCGQLWKADKVAAKRQSNNIGAHQRLLSVKTNGKTELFYFCGVRT